MASPTQPPTADLLVCGARLVVTMGWVAVTRGRVSGIGPAGSEPPPTR